MGLPNNEGSRLSKKPGCRKGSREVSPEYLKMMREEIAREVINEMAEEWLGLLPDTVESLLRRLVDRSSL